MRSFWNVSELVLYSSLLFFLDAHSASLAMDRCEPTQRDGSWQGEDFTGFLEKLRALVDNHSVSADFEQTTAVLGEPQQIFRINDRIRADWVLEASREFEKFGCGSVSSEVQWEFLIIEMEWISLNIKSCSIYKKSAFVEKAQKPNPFSSMSPLDSEFSCISYLNKTTTN